MKALVTGGAGFIGSHLSEAILKLAREVTILDNFSSGRMSNLNKILSSNAHAKLIRGDCKNPRELFHGMHGIDVVFHFAANPEIRLTIADPTTCFQENVYATYVLLEQLKQSSVSAIVFVSTSTVYGDTKIIPTPESYGPLEPISIYGASKLASEALIASYCHTFNRKAIILRLANIVGPRSRHGVINDFITRLRRNPRELEILGDGTQTKSYLHVADCVQAILVALEKSQNQVEIFNVGSDDQISVRSIAEIVMEEMGLKKTKLIITGGVDGGRGWIGDVKRMRLDITKLKSLGWKPRYSSAEAIRLAVRAQLRALARNMP